MEQRKFVKLSDLVNNTFTIEQVRGYMYKQWDEGAGRMISETKWFEGSRKVYTVVTDKGTLDMSENQLAGIFVKVQQDGVANIIGTKVLVKSNGKSGMEIRYYLNPERGAPTYTPKDRMVDPDNEKFNLDEIPF